VYSLNVPVPAEVARLAGELARELPAARTRARGTHTLGVKRLDHERDRSYARLETQVRELLAGQPPFEVQISGIDLFPDPPVGTAPVVYLVVESEELRALHEKLIDTFEPIDQIDGDGYDPHVTIARGGSPEQARQMTERSIDPISWEVDELLFWDAERKQAVSRLSLPA
jgi:2'-5' RNA ligase